MLQKKGEGFKGQPFLCVSVSVCLLLLHVCLRRTGNKHQTLPNTKNKTITLSPVHRHSTQLNRKHINKHNAIYIKTCWFHSVTDTLNHVSCMCVCVCAQCVVYVFQQAQQDLAHNTLPKTEVNSEQWSVKFSRLSQSWTCLSNAMQCNLLQLTKLTQKNCHCHCHSLFFWSFVVQSFRETNVTLRSGKKWAWLVWAQCLCTTLQHDVVQCWFWFSTAHVTVTPSNINDDTVVGITRTQ